MRLERVPELTRTDDAKKSTNTGEKVQSGLDEDGKKARNKGEIESTSAEEKVQNGEKAQNGLDEDGTNPTGEVEMLLEGFPIRRRHTGRENADDMAPSVAARGVLGRPKKTRASRTQASSRGKKPSAAPRQRSLEASSSISMASSTGSGRNTSVSGRKESADI